MVCTSFVALRAWAADPLLETREAWDVFFVQGAKVGYAHTSVQPFRQGDETLLRIEMLYRLKLKRFGETSEEELRLVSVETQDGQVRQFESRMGLGNQPIVVSGRLDADAMQVVTTSAGKKLTHTLAWAPDVGGYYAGDGSLLRKPMQPGERRTYRALLPPMNEIVAFEMVAQAYERTPLLSGAYELLHIDSTAHLSSGTTLTTTLWANRRGEVLKSHSDALGQDTYRVTKSQALDERGLAAFDLGKDTIVRTARPLAGNGFPERARYRVTVADGKPAEIFAQSTNQQLQNDHGDKAELSVYAVALSADHSSTDPEPAAEDCQANSMIQSDDPQIRQMAEEAVAGRTDPLDIARTLEQYVHDNISQKNFTQAFATAAEVAATREGDCTEHAVLLAALLRARGIAARVAIGLVYSETLGGFGYHMWTEAYLDHRWQSLDATLARGGIGAGHLKLGHSSLAGASAYTSLLPVAQVLGRLKIEVLESE